MQMQNPLLDKFDYIAQLMWQRGWTEANGGNMTVRMTAEQVADFGGALHPTHRVALDFDAREIAGEDFLCTGRSKYFRHIHTAPEANLALIQIDADGAGYTQYWGEATPTSEVATHLLCHTVRKPLNKGREHTIMHCHLPNLIALSFVLPSSDLEFSRQLWLTMPECMVMFPEGVGVVPYMTPGTVEIGEATAEKMKDYRIVMWAEHGTLVCDKDLESGFGLLEAAEKAAEIVLKILSVGGKLLPKPAKNIAELEYLHKIKLNPKIAWG